METGFYLYFSLENADPDIVGILRRVTDKIESVRDWTRENVAEGVIRDANGNAIGRYSTTDQLGDDLEITGLSLQEA